MKAVYPAVFIPENKGEYSVIFPDLSGCNTCGDNLTHALEMAQEALGLYLVALEESKQVVPKPSNPSAVKTEENSFVTLVTTNVNLYRRNKAVKKTLTIPQWLNDEAMKKGINFSQTLQNALIEELHA